MACRKQPRVHSKRTPGGTQEKPLR